MSKLNSGITYTISPTKTGWELRTDKWLTGSTSHPEIKDEKILRGVHTDLNELCKFIPSVEVSAMIKQAKPDLYEEFN